MRNKDLVLRRNKALIEKYVQMVIKEKISHERAYNILINDIFYISEATINKVMEENKDYLQKTIAKVRGYNVKLKLE